MTADLFTATTLGATMAFQSPEAVTIAADLTDGRTGPVDGQFDSVVAVPMLAASPASGALNGRKIDWTSLGHKTLFQRFHVVTEEYPLERFAVELALGNVLSAQNRTVSLWNAFFDQSVTVTSITVNADGVTISGISTPVVIAPLSTATFLVAIATTGAPILTGDITVNTTAGAFVIPITGRRVVEFSFVPQQPVRESLEFSTNIITAHDGSEQRIAQRAAPVQVFTYRVRQTDEQAQELHYLLFDWMSRLFGVPIFWEQQQLTSMISAAQTVIPVNPDSADHQVAGLAYITEPDASTHEIFEVAAINAGTSLEASLPLVSSYSAQAYVCPARLCFLNQQARQNVYAYNAQDLDLQFTTIDSKPIEEIAYDDTYNGLPYFGDPNFFEGRSTARRFSNNRSRTDFGKLPYQQQRQDRATVAIAKGWQAQTRAEVWKIRSWMHQLKGSQGVFYLPTFRRDFTLATAVGAAAQTLDVVNAGFNTFVGAREPWAAIEIVLNDGTEWRRDITSTASVDSTTERIGINAALGQTVEIQDIDRISLVMLCRIGADTVQLRHERAGQAFIAIQAVGVRA